MGSLTLSNLNTYEYMPDSWIDKCLKCVLLPDTRVHPLHQSYWLWVSCPPNPGQYPSNILIWLFLVKFLFCFLFHIWYMSVKLKFIFSWKSFLFSTCSVATTNLRIIYLFSSTSFDQQKIHRQEYWTLLVNSLCAVNFLIRIENNFFSLFTHKNRCLWNTYAPIPQHMKNRLDVWPWPFTCWPEYL